MNCYDSLTMWHEEILKRIIVSADELYAPEGVLEFAAKDHLHSFTEAFGLPERRLAAKCLDAPVRAVFVLDEVYNSSGKKSRIELKLTAMLSDWKKYVCPVEISLNGKVFFNRDVFLENVAKGWPSIYFELPAELLVKGKNTLVIANRGNDKEKIIFINKFEIIEKHPYPKPDEESPALDIPQNALPLYAGGDTDDIRNDGSPETDFFLELLHDTCMGNYTIFRPKYRRNYFYPPSFEIWKKRIEYCEKNKIFFRITEWPLPGDPFPLDYLKEKSVFQGVHVHESYLLLQTIKNPQFYRMRRKPTVDSFIRAEDAEEARSCYIQHIRGEIDQYRSMGVPVAFGEPSQLVPYLPIEQGDVIQAEPVGNSSFLFAGVRAAAETNGVLWGAHIAVDWYLGFPHDASASRRFRLMCNICYTHGASWVYAENSLLKTNAYERYDREDEFCVDNRNILRDFYRYSSAHPRRGKPVIPLAAVYGNLESILWYPDDRIPELKDTNDFDLHFWGKWDFTDNLWCWRGLDGWLPPLSANGHRDNPSMLEFFSGTPFGQVDVVPVQADSCILSNYRCLAFLGWNTMTESIYEKLLEYVTAGGTLYISAYHFDTRKSPDQKTEYIYRGDIENLAGVALTYNTDKADKFEFKESSFFPEKENFHLCGLKLLSAEPLLEDFSGNPLVTENRVGKGKVYFGNFRDFPCKGEMLRFNREFLKFLGSETSDSLIEYTEGINYSLWEEDGASRAFFLNIDWKEQGNIKRFNFKPWGESIPLSVREGNIREVFFDEHVGVTSENSNLSFKSMDRLNCGEANLTVSGNGKCSLDFFLKEGEIKDIKRNGASLNPRRKNKKWSIDVCVEGRENFRIAVVKKEPVKPS